MLVTKHFVFIHLQRTGGEFVRWACREHLPPGWILEDSERTHAGCDLIPDEHAHLPALMFVRNPWDWYVSWYHRETQRLAHMDNAPIANTHPWVTLLERGAVSFDEAVRRACTRRDGARPWEIAMRAWDVDLLTATYALKSGRYPGELPPELGPRRARNGQAVEVCRFERLREDFVAFLARHEVPAPDEFISAVRSAPPRNTSEHGSYRDYYDDELRALVGRGARHLVGAHGYEF